VGAVSGDPFMLDDTLKREEIAFWQAHGPDKSIPVFRKDHSPTTA